MPVNIRLAGSIGNDPGIFLFHDRVYGSCILCRHDRHGSWQQEFAQDQAHLQTKATVFIVVNRYAVYLG